MRPWVPSLALQTGHSERLLEAAGKGHYYHVTDGEPPSLTGKKPESPIILASTLHLNLTPK